jgi:hypothetical protein
VVDSCHSGTSDHVRGAGTDGTGAGKRPLAVAHFCKGNRKMYLCLLVTREVKGKVRIFLQCLTNPSNIAMSKDAPYTGKKLILPAIVFDLLIL